jgi:hypothetical protein
VIRAARSIAYGEMAGPDMHQPKGGEFSSPRIARDPASAPSADRSAHISQDPPVSAVGSMEDHVSETIDELGSVDWLVLEFPGSKFTGGIAPVLDDLTDKGLIRVLDLLVVKKDADGGFEAFEIEDLEGGELGELRAYESALAMILGEQDLADIATVIEPGSSAAILVWENKWSAPFGAAVRHAGGQLVARGTIPTQAVLAALEAEAEEQLETETQERG